MSEQENITTNENKTIDSSEKKKNELKRVKAEQQIEEKNQRALELNVEDDKKYLAEQSKAETPETQVNQ